MMKLDRQIITGIRAAESGPDLHYYLKNAVRLEHATIPPYLTAMFSLKPGVNDGIARLIRSIVLQEMLHMTIASNILVAIGGSPMINIPSFIPQYPGPLPLSIGGAGFIVGLEPFSKPLVQSVFMAIEEPEHPIPVAAFAAQPVPDFATIGEFYDALKKKLAGFPDSIYGRTERQVTRWFPANVLFPITNGASAGRGIDIIVDQGEGTSTDPFQSPGDPAHYYKFGEIFYGRKIVKTPTGFAYAGAPVHFDPTGVYPMRPNPKINYFERGSQARMKMEEFSYAYSSLLNTLHNAFNGDPALIDQAIGLMYGLKMIAVSLMQTPLGDGSNMTAGPSYEYINVVQAAA